MRVEIMALRAGDEGILDHVDEDVFDYPIRADSTFEFLSDPRHHLVVAIDDGVVVVVGMASGGQYIYRDKAAEFWVNEVGVASSHRRSGIAKAILADLLAFARQIGKRELMSTRL